MPFSLAAMPLRVEVERGIGSRPTEDESFSRTYRPPASDRYAVEMRLVGVGEPGRIYGHHHIVDEDAQVI
ncbi:MAG: hypothetical protein ACREA0_14380, partial [bacterium]